VFREDVAHDGEPEARSPAFGGKVRQKQFLFLIRGDAAAGVRENDFNHVSLAGACLNSQNLCLRFLHGFGRIIDEIDDYAFELLGIDRYLRQIRRQIHAHIDPFQSIGEYPYAARHHVVQFARNRLRRGQS